jgi:hypothetical protein
MSNRPHGQHVYIDDDYPQALGICDVTGFIFLRQDLVRQMEWRGNALVWTGLYVGRPYVSMPNEQNRPPISFPDPRAIIDPRPQIPISSLIPALPENQRLAQLQSLGFISQPSNGLPVT